MITTDTAHRLEGGEQNPELRLAIAVVEQALSDIQIYARALRGRRTPGWYYRLETARRDAQEARAFLLVDLWEPGNPFGDILLHHGARRFTKARLVHADRTLGQI